VNASAVRRNAARTRFHGGVSQIGSVADKAFYQESQGKLTLQPGRWEIGSAAANAPQRAHRFVAGGVSGNLPDRIWIQTPSTWSSNGGPELRDQWLFGDNPLSSTNILSTLSQHSIP